MRKAITSLTLSSKKNEKKTVVDGFEEPFGKNSCSVIDFRSEEFISKLRARKTNYSRQLFLNGNDEIDNHYDSAFKNTVNLKNIYKRKMSDDKENSCKYNKMAKLELADDIQHQIDDQIRMREGAMKLMSACSTLNQALETSKNMLTINARVLGLMSALQKKKEQHVLEEYNKQKSSSNPDIASDCSNGRLAISDIRVPLMWKDNVHFTGKTGDQSYYAFALLRCGDQVRDTLLYEITSADTDMYFDHTIIFEDLNPDFKVEFELYYTVITSNESHGIRTPIRTPMHLRTPKKTIHFKAPKFCLAGHAILNSDDIKAGMISKDLVMGSTGASGVAVLGDIKEFPIHPLELWGQICCELSAQPKCMMEEDVAGPVLLKLENEWKERHCAMYQCKVHCWTDAQEATGEPQQIIHIKNNYKITELKDNSNTLQLQQSDNTIVQEFKYKSADDVAKWKRSFSKTLRNIEAWKYACEVLMHIEEVKIHRLSIPSKASFYDQIQIDIKNNELNAKLNGHKASIISNDEKIIQDPVVSEHVNDVEPNNEKINADQSNNEINIDQSSNEQSNIDQSGIDQSNSDQSMDMDSDETAQITLSGATINETSTDEKESNLSSIENETNLNESGVEEINEDKEQSDVASKNAALNVTEESSTTDRVSESNNEEIASSDESLQKEEQPIKVDENIKIIDEIEETKEVDNAEKKENVDEEIKEIQEDQEDIKESNKEIMETIADVSETKESNNTADLLTENRNEKQETETFIQKTLLDTDTLEQKKGIETSDEDKDLKTEICNENSTVSSSEENLEVEKPVIVDEKKSLTITTSDENLVNEKEKEESTPEKNIDTSDKKDIENEKPENLATFNEEKENNNKEEPDIPTKTEVSDIPNKIEEHESGKPSENNIENKDNIILEENKTESNSEPTDKSKTEDLPNNNNSESDLNNVNSSDNATSKVSLQKTLSNTQTTV